MQRYPTSFMRRGIFYPVILLVISMTLSARAGIAGEPVKLKLRDAYALALSNHESVRIAEEAISQADSVLSQATASLLPTVSLDGSYTRYQDAESTSGFVVQPEDSSKIDLKLTQSLYSGGKEWSARRQAILGLTRTRSAFEEAKEEVVISTARGFFSVLKSEKEVEIKTAALKRAEERKKVADARFKVGEVTRSAVLRADAEVAGAAAELIKATGTLKDSKTALKRIVGIADDLIVEEPEHIDIAPSDVEGFIKTALDHRKDYIEAGLDEDIAREAVRYAYGGFLPTVKLEGIYSIKAQNPETTFFQEDTAYATLSLSYPLFEGGLRMAEVSEAQSKLRGAELARLKLKRDIEVEINQAFNNIEAFSAALNSYKKQLQFAEEDYNMVFEQFKYGIATTVDVIDSDASLISAQRSMMNANFDLSLAVIELKYLSGTLLEGIAY